MTVSGPVSTVKTIFEITYNNLLRTRWPNGPTDLCLSFGRFWDQAVTLPATIEGTRGQVNRPWSTATQQLSSWHPGQHPFLHVQDNYIETVLLRPQTWANWSGGMAVAVTRRWWNHLSKRSNIKKNELNWDGCRGGLKWAKQQL